MLKCENLPRTNSTKYETQNILVKFQQNEHTPAYVKQIFMQCSNVCTFVKYHPICYPAFQIYVVGVEWYIGELFWS